MECVNSGRYLAKSQDILIFQKHPQMSQFPFDSASTTLIGMSTNYMWGAPWGPDLVWPTFIWLQYSPAKYLKIVELLEKKKFDIGPLHLPLPPLPSRCADTLFSKTCLDNTSHHETCDDHFISKMGNYFIPRHLLKRADDNCDAMITWPMKFFPYP